MTAGTGREITVAVVQTFCPDLMKSSDSRRLHPPSPPSAARQQ